MKLSTAINVLKRECDFLGLNIVDLLDDINKHGRMVYSQRAVEAAEVYNAQRNWLLCEV